MITKSLILPGECPFPAVSKQLWYIIPDGYRDTGMSSPSAFKRAGYSLVVLNDICDDLGDVLGYNVPDAGIPTFDEIKTRIEQAIGQQITCPTFIEYTEGVFGNTIDLYEFPDEGTEEPFAAMLLDALSPKRLVKESSPSKKKSPRRRIFADLFDSKLQPPDEPILEAGDLSLPQMECDACPAGSPPIPEEDETDALESIIERLKAIKQEELLRLGFDERMLRFLAGKAEPTYSRLHITRSARIILEDYGGREIKLDDKTKALYFLYLRHPEGLSIKDLPEHMEEVLDLYQSISGRDDPEAMRSTIENLCNPFENNANISLSRIKKAFIEAFNESLAKAYYVAGRKGEARTIALDRSLVIWDTIR